MMYKIKDKVHMQQGIGKNHLSMCGINISTASKQQVEKPTCKNCIRVMQYRLKTNQFYQKYL